MKHESKQLTSVIIFVNVYSVIICKVKKINYVTMKNKYKKYLQFKTMITINKFKNINLSDQNNVKQLFGKIMTVKQKKR